MNGLINLVKWVDDSEDSWIDEDDFSAVELINKYWQNIYNAKTANLPQVTSSNKESVSAN